MGRPKLLLPLRGKSVVAWVIDAAVRSRCDEVLVVVGEAAEQVADEATRCGARTVLNPRFAEGMGTSLAAGVGAVVPACEGVVVLLGDQPGVTPRHVDLLIDAYRATGRPIVTSRYGAVRGAPTLFARALFPELLSLTGEAGGRTVLDRHLDLVVDIPMDSSVLWDVDTPEDYARLTQLFP